MSFFSKIRDTLTGLGKNLGSSALFNKAKEFISGASDFLKSKSTKNIVDGISQYIPKAQDYFKSAKDFTNIGNQLINKGGLEKKFNRSMDSFKKSDNLSQNFQDRLQNFQDRFKKKSSIELQPKQQRDDSQFDTSSIFG